MFGLAGVEGPELDTGITSGYVQDDEVVGVVHGGVDEIHPASGLHQVVSASPGGDVHWTGTDLILRLGGGGWGEGKRILHLYALSSPLLSL